MQLRARFPLSTIDLPVRQKLLLLVLIPLAFEFLFVALLSALLTYTEQETDKYEQSKEVLLQFHMAEASLARMLFEIVPSYVNSNDEYMPNFARMKANIVRSREIAMKAATIRPELTGPMEAAPALYERALLLVDKGDKVFHNPHILKRKRPKYLRQDGMDLVIEFREVARKVSDAEKQMKKVAPAELDRLRLLLGAVMAFGVVMSMLISGGAAVLFTREIAARLKVIESNARMLERDEALPEPISGKDEIAELDKSLHDASALLHEFRVKEFTVLYEAADVICSLNADFEFTALGAAATRSWGRQAQELQGKSILSILHPPSQKIALETLRRLAQVKSEGEFETQLVCGDGSLKDILWKVDWQQENQSFYCVAHDISERRAVERLKQKFISIVSHDLRTPLTAVSSSFDLLTRGSKGELPPKAQRELEKAQQSLDRLMELVRDLLDLEKLESGKVVMSLSCVSALDVCSAACDSMDALAGKLGIQIQRPFGDAAIMGDERRLVQVVMNILSNAIKFSPKGSTVRIEIKDVGNAAEISIIDNGPGIPAVDLPHIFERFKQSQAQSKDIKGTGLGLAIAKQIVDAHGGQIGVESTEGQGTRFFLQIPLFQEAAIGSEVVS